MNARVASSTKSLLHVLVMTVESADMTMMESLARGDMPVSSHGSLTMHPAARKFFVSDFDPQWDYLTRDQAIDRSNILRAKCDLVVFYEDLGWSSGMLTGRAHCEAHGLPYQVRTLDVDLLLGMKSALVTRELVQGVLTGNFQHLLRDADANIVTSKCSGNGGGSGRQDPAGEAAAQAAGEAAAQAHAAGKSTVMQVDSPRDFSLGCIRL